jgi:hypothetical protein
MKESTINVIGILTLFLIISGCKITLVPNYDAALVEKIESIAKTTDMFYLNMLETTKNDSTRAYKKFVKEYIAIEVELNSILNKNKVKPLNEHSVRICEITLNLWIKYREEHKSDNELSDGLIKLNRKTFSDLFYAMQVAEDAKQIVSNPPQ